MNRKRLFKLCILLAGYTCLISGLTGCYKEIALPVAADFTYQVSNNFVIPATVTLTNATQGGELFTWTFDGGEPATSTQKTPGEVIYRKPGTYTIRLEASNLDGVKQVVEKKITIDSKLSASFSYSIVGDSFAPATVHFANQSVGYDRLEWTFEGGSPATSDQPDPVVRFEVGGSQKVSIKLINAHSTILKDSVITLEPELTADFDLVVPAQYEELEAPVTLNLTNKSAGSVSSSWTMEGADVLQSQQPEPTVRFSKAGIYTITLETSNGKKTKRVSKSITIKPSKGYAYIQNVELGIYSARNSRAIYYSTQLRKAFTEAESIQSPDAGTIDLLFFGLDESFAYNRFLSPSEAASIGLAPVPGVGKTRILNPAQVTDQLDFDKLDADQLKALSIGSPTSDQDDYFDESSPKLVVFENALKQKGVIFIRQYLKDGVNSRIRCDIKVLK
ncbi:MULTISPECIES: PKD domain-containing protein [unclassified Spirosoma]|uniref:PKD domain-containing protein n=1 Tax=unclassified Spirosoma TaxID=2621999 RepID=UPI000AC55557|nr:MULTISPECIES: PKD domain-containing protein [unclassified Spirosoma]MBN8824293.1 PKD domain-containing protein [Spirosoma sp.]